MVNKERIRGIWCNDCDRISVGKPNLGTMICGWCDSVNVKPNIETIED